MLPSILLLTLSPLFAITMALRHQSGKESNDLRKKQNYNFMLLERSEPSNYKVRLTPYLSGNFKFVGETEITLKILELTNNIVLHAKKLTINESLTTLISESGASIQPQKHEYDNVFDFLTLSFKDDLMPGYYTLTFNFTGELGTESYGFYRRSYVNEKKRNVWVAATQFVPMGARRTFPCWDEPEFKATFDVVIRHYPNYTALSNMPKKEQSSMDQDGMLWTTFDRTPLMSTSVVGFVLIDFDHIPKNDSTVRIWCAKEYIDQFAYVLEISEDAIRMMEKHVYPIRELPKIDHIALPYYYNDGIKNRGLLLYMKDEIIYNPNVMSISVKQDKVLNVLHGIAQIWFGNLVSPLFWNYAWLSNGFAMYFSYVLADELFPDWRVFDTYGAEVMPYIFERDRIPTVPLNQPILNASENQMEYFSWTAQHKASAVLRMAVHIVSKRVFDLAVYMYLIEHAYSTVTPDDFSAALEIAVGTSNALHLNFTVKEFLDTWENQVGYPIVNVARNYTTGETLLTQEAAFVSNPGYINKDTSSAMWWIPISYATESKPNFSQTEAKEWMMPKPIATKIKGVRTDDWIILNVQQTGLYGVKYDPRNWERIARYLNSDNYTNIHVINRINLIRDAYNLLHNKQMDPVTFFQLMSYFERENETLPWNLAVKIIDRMCPFIMAPEQESVFRPRILRFINTIVKHVGFEENEDDDPATEMLRPEIRKIACQYDHADCNIPLDQIETSIANLEAFENILPEKYWLVCTTLRKNGDAKWPYVLELYNKYHRLRELICLFCTSDSVRFTAALDLIIRENSPVKEDGLMNVVQSIMYLNPMHVDIAVDYFVTKKEKFKNQIDIHVFQWEMYTKKQFEKLLDNFPLNATKEKKLLARENATIYVLQDAVSKIHKWLQENAN